MTVCRAKYMRLDRLTWNEREAGKQKKPIKGAKRTHYVAPDRYSRRSPMTPSPVCPLVEKVHVSVITSTQLLKRNLSQFVCECSCISYLAATDNIYEPCILIQMNFSFQGLIYSLCCLLSIYLQSFLTVWWFNLTVKCREAEWGRCEGQWEEGLNMEGFQMLPHFCFYMATVLWY